MLYIQVLPTPWSSEAGNIQEKDKGRGLFQIGSGEYQKKTISYVAKENLSC